MKRLKKFIYVYVVIQFLSYVSISLVLLDFNIAHWSFDTRGVLFAAVPFFDIIIASAFSGFLEYLFTGEITK